jgi:hypothetical protein
MQFPEKARAITARPIPPTWLELERWVDGLPGESVTGAGVSVSEWPDGRDVHFSAASEPWRYPFKVAISGTRATVRPGLLNLVMPRIPPLPTESGDPDGLYLDGTDLAGQDTGSRPTLEVLGQERGGPGPDGRSFVCLSVRVNTETGALFEPFGRDPVIYDVTVVHSPELPPGFQNGGMPETLQYGGLLSTGLFPLAILYWNDTGTAIRRHFQVVQHNLSHRYQPGAASAEPGARGPGRHWFFGVT